MKTMTQKQAQYQARRAAVAEFSARMSDNHAPGKASQRFDSAELSARLAYDSKLREHGFSPDRDRQDYRFSETGRLII